MTPVQTCDESGREPSALGCRTSHGMWCPRAYLSKLEMSEMTVRRATRAMAAQFHEGAWSRTTPG